MSDTKFCKKCQQEINQAAQICPHCKMPQSFVGHLKLYVPFVIAFGFIILLINVVTNWYGQTDKPKQQDCSQANTPVAQFSAQQNELLIQSSEFSFVELENSNQVAVMGLIANNSDTTWGSVKFEVRFFDADGNMIDAFNSMEYELAIQANTESSFRLIELAAKDIESYATHQIRITDAHVVSEYY